MSNIYEATVTHEGKYWIIDIPEIDALTQARSESEVELMARQLVAVTKDIPLADAKVKIITSA